MAKANIAGFLARFKAKEMTEIMKDNSLTAKDKETKLEAVYNELKALQERDKAEQSSGQAKTKALGAMKLEELKALADSLRNPKGEDK